MIIGKRIKARRKEKGLTQKQLALASGFYEGQIQNYELGMNIPRPVTLKKIANALDTDIYYLLDIAFNKDMAIEQFLDGIGKEVKPELNIISKFLDISLADCVDLIFKDGFRLIEESCCRYMEVAREVTSLHVGNEVKRRYLDGDDELTSP